MFYALQKVELVYFVSYLQTGNHITYYQAFTQVDIINLNTNRISSNMPSDLDVEGMKFQETY